MSIVDITVTQTLAPPPDHARIGKLSSGAYLWGTIGCCLLCLLSTPIAIASGMLNNKTPCISFFPPFGSRAALSSAHSYRHVDRPGHPGFGPITHASKSCPSVDAHSLTLCAVCLPLSLVLVLRMLSFSSLFFFLLSLLFLPVRRESKGCGLSAITDIAVLFDDEATPDGFSKIANPVYESVSMEGFISTVFIAVARSGSNPVVEIKLVGMDEAVGEGFEALRRDLCHDTDKVIKAFLAFKTKTGK
jgi:hypothetical protein